MTQGRQLTTQRPQQLQPIDGRYSIIGEPRRDMGIGDTWETETLTSSDGQQWVVPVRPASRQTVIINHNYAAPPTRDSEQPRVMDYVELDRQDEAMYRIESRRKQWRDSMFARESGLADISFPIIVFAIVAVVSLVAMGGPHWLVRF